jgi:hypothetical protein
MIGIFSPLFSMRKAICKRRLWKQASLSIRGSAEGNWRGRFFTRHFERKVKNGSGNDAPLPIGALRGEPGGRTSLLVSEIYVKEGSDNVICLHGDPVEGTWRGSFTCNIERQEKGLCKRSLSLYGTWREGSSTEDPDRHVKKKTLENSRI